MTNEKYYAGMTAADFCDAYKRDDLQPWIVEDLLPVGFSILAAREKTGKSLMALGSIALPIASGLPVLGHFQPTQGTVLYFALEESPNTIGSRLTTLLADDDHVRSSAAFVRIYLSDHVDTWTDQAIGQIHEQITQFENVRCVIIDTLRLVAPSQAKGDGDGYDFQYKLGTRLQQMAITNSIAIVGIHHTTKMQYTDKFDSISGSAYTKAAETMMVFERDGGNYKLHVRGRSLPTSTYNVIQDPVTLKYSAELSSTVANAPQRRSLRAQVTLEDVFRDDSALTSKELRARLKQVEISGTTADRWVRDQLDSKRMIKDEALQIYTRSTASLDNPAQAAMPFESASLPMDDIAAAAGAQADMQLTTPAVAPPPASMDDIAAGGDGQADRQTMMLAATPPPPPSYPTSGGGGAVAHTTVRSMDNEAVIGSLFNDNRSLRLDDLRERFDKIANPPSAFDVWLQQMVEARLLNAASNGGFIMRL